VSLTPFPSKPSPEQRAAADRRLVEACLSEDAGDRGWEAFVTQFAGLVSHVVTRTAERRQRPLADADRDDLVAEVFFEVLRNQAAVMKGFAGRSSLAAYVTVIARRIAGRRLLDTRRTTRPTASAEMEQLPQAHATSSAKRVDDREQVAALLEGLDADEAKIVRLFHIEERSYGEISRLLGIPLGSVGPVLSKARAKLRRQAG
jgi:RNA polymerase sigma-70 factor (ECF subfamily)